MLLLAGAPGTGKTYTGNVVKKNFPSFIVLPLDLFKENIYDEIGFENLSQKNQLDEEARQRFYRATEIIMNWGKPIMADYPFSYKQKPNLEALSKKYGYQVVTLRLEADQKVLYERQKQRDLNEPRHLGHLLNKYHRGDVLKDEKPKDGMPSFSLFKKRMDDRKYSSFKLGKLISVNVNDYSKIDYKEIMKQLGDILSDTN